MGALLALARDNRLTEIRGIGPARKRTIEVSLRLAGCDLGEPTWPPVLPPRPTPMIFWRRKADEPDAQDAARLLDQMWSPERVARLMRSDDEDDESG